MSNQGQISDERIAQRAEAAEHAVLAKGDLLVQSHLWTPEFHQRAQAWLNNFSGEERRLAATLLDGFLYFSDRHATELMVSAFHALSAESADQTPGGGPPKDAWASFYDDCVVSWIDGEQPHATDSGSQAARIFRKRVGFPETRVKSPQEALAMIMLNKTRSVLFVDDFIGSGNQLAHTLNRTFGFKHDGGLLDMSFDLVAPKLSDVDIYCCPSVATTFALDRHKRERPWLKISAGVVLDERYDVLHPQSAVWPPELREEGQAFVRTVSDRLGLRDTGGGVDDRDGFNKLGLAVAVRDTIPDASLGLFRHSQNWQPLMKVT